MTIPQGRKMSLAIEERKISCINDDNSSRKKNVLGHSV
jgi:hypothetical protein